MKYRLWIGVFSLCLLALQPVCSKSNNCLSIDANPRDFRQIVFISDLHIGLAREIDKGKTESDSEFSPMEDFRWEKEFQLFLNKMQEIGAKASLPTDLIIVGDFLELWQWAGDSCGQPRKGNLGCSEAQAIDLVQQIVASRRPIFLALGDFVGKGNNRILILPGNHDAALVYKKVAEIIEKAIPAEPGKVRVVREGYWLSSDMRIFVEHGHQIEGDTNTFRDKDLPASCTDTNEQPVDCNTDQTVAYLQRSFGENFVQKFYNRYEDAFPIIDNLSKESTGVMYGVEALNLTEIGSVVQHGFKFLLLQQTYAQVMQGLGEGANLDAVHQWDYTKIREKESRFLVESIPRGTVFRKEAEKLLSLRKLNLVPADLTNDEIDQLCAIRTGLIEEKKLDADGCPETGKPPGLGAAATNLLRNRNTILAEHLNYRKTMLANLEGQPQEFEYFIFGHTHKAEFPYSPFEPGERWRPRVMNTGAWQRTATPAQLKAIQKAKNISNEEALLTLNPGDLYPCYTYVRIMPDKYGNCEPLLEYWVQDPDSGKWKISVGCPYPQ